MSTPAGPYLVLYGPIQTLPGPLVSPDSRTDLLDNGAVLMPPLTTPEMTSTGQTSAAPPAPRWIRIVGAIAVLWNLIGLVSFLADAGEFGPGAVAPGVTLMPAVVFVAYGVSCVTGVAGSLGLALRRRWARPVLWISAVAAVIDWGWVLAYASNPAVPLGVAVLSGAGLLVWLSEMATRRTWLV
jgi:hypothetical protein